MSCVTYLNSLTYKKPQDYKKKVFNLISANNDFLKHEWMMFIEIKARRDIAVHNNWLINDIYINKIKKTGIKCPDHNTYLYPTGKYMLKSMKVGDSFYNKIIEHIIKKFS